MDAQQLTIVVPGVATNVITCACGEYDCFICSEEILRQEDEDLREMGYTVSCNRCWNVDRRHCFSCRACPDQHHSDVCEYYAGQQMGEETPVDYPRTWPTEAFDWE